MTPAAVAGLRDRIAALNERRVEIVESMVSAMLAGQDPSDNALDEMARIETRLSALATLEIRLEGGAL